MSYAQPPPPPGPPPSDFPLPPGWTRLISESGTPYYHNAADGTTSWNPPPPNHSPPSAPPPPPPPPHQASPPTSAAPYGYPAQTPHEAPPPQTFPSYRPPGYTQFPPDPNAPQPYPTHTPSMQQSYLPHQQPASQPYPTSQPPMQPQYSAQNPYASQPPPMSAPSYQHPPLHSQPSHYPPHQQQPAHQPPHYPPRPQQPEPIDPYTQGPAYDLNSQPSYPSNPGLYPNPSHSGPPPQQPYPTGYPSSPATSYPVNPTPSSMDSIVNRMSNVNISSAPTAGGVVHVNLEMKAVGLMNKDFLGKSDPICYVQVPHPSTPPGAAIQQVAKWITYGETEICENNLSPTWAKRVNMQYQFEKHQIVRFLVIDVDNPKTKKGDKLGHCVTSLSQIVRNGLLTLALTKGHNNSVRCGELIVRAHDENQAGKVRVRLALSSSGLDKKDTFGKSDPYYVIKHIVGAGNRGTSTLYKSEVIKNNLNPTWKPHTLQFSTENMPWDKIQLQVVVNDWDKFTPHDLIGEASFSLADLTTKPSFDLINGKKAKKRNYKNSGKLNVLRADAVELPNFISYLQGGLRLDFIVAVDFTASNKPVDDPTSLHYMSDPQRPSQYSQALRAVGNVLKGYIPDGRITALGFGACLPGQGRKPSFDFSLTGEQDPRVLGVSGLLAAYELAAKKVALSGPTYFTPLIRNVTSMASSYPVSQADQHFSVLLILTDGAVTDLPETIDAIIDCSNTAPVAIVIVGIGNADFSSMKRLDGDDKRLRSDSGREAKHDIVQFTQFDRRKATEVIAAEVLQEIPQRVVEYMVDAGIKPNPPRF